MVGVTQRGPAHKATLCTSFDEYQAAFGGYAVGAEVALAAKGYFENGGSQLWVSRVTSAAAATATTELVKEGPPTYAFVRSTFPGPYTVASASSFHRSLSVDVSVGGEVTSWTLLLAASYANMAAQAGHPYALTNGDTLEVRVNGGDVQTVTFFASDFADIGAATRNEVIGVLGQLSDVFVPPFSTDRFILRTDRWGSSASIEIVGGSAASVLGLEGTEIGFGEVPDLSSITVDDFIAAAANQEPSPVDFVDAGGGVLEIRTRAVGPDVTLVVTGDYMLTGFNELGLDTNVHSGVGTVPVVRVDATGPGDAGNLLSVDVTAASGGGAEQFDLIVREDGVQRERFLNLSRDPVHPRFIETVINESSTRSSYIRVTNLPDVPGEAPTLAADVLLEEGSDGDPLTEADYIGDEASETGLHAFDNVPDLSLLLVPGQATSAVHNAMLQYCEVTRDGTAFAILDPPAGATAATMVTYVSTNASLENASEYGAIYWPRVKILNPNKAVFGNDPQIVVAPSGIVAGVFARTDSARPGGVYDNPAGVEVGRVFNVLGFETEETRNERKRDLVYPHRINPITQVPGTPNFIDGSRTLKGGGAFPSVAERRGVIFIERSLKSGLQFARHKNNTPDLRAQVRRTITSFLLAQMNNGAFASREPSKAFFVDVSDQLNTPSVVAAGKLIARIGLATNKPAEFVIIQISQDTRALEAELGG
jgi:hypothetical protein